MQRHKNGRAFARVVALPGASPPLTTARVAPHVISMGLGGEGASRPVVSLTLSDSLWPASCVVEVAGLPGTRAGESGLAVRGAMPTGAVSVKDGSSGKAMAARALNRSSMRLRPTVTISEQSSEVFTARWSSDGRFLAAGCGDGAVRVFNGQTGKLAFK